MKPLTKPTGLLLLLIFILSACSKERLFPQPQPGNGGGEPAPVAEKAMVSFMTNADLTGQPYHTSNLRAVVTIANDKGEEVVKEKILSVTLPNPVKTESIELPVGNYKLTSFRMEYGSVYTHFATPVSGSAKAVQVQHPLAKAFTVEKNKANEQAVEVLRVQQGEKPQQYGYPSGAFDGGQDDASPFVKIKLKAIMQIGDVLYDSIPAALTITTYNSNGERTTTYTHLQAGTNEVQLAKAAVKYDLLVSKWGTNDGITLERKDIDNATVFTLGGSKAAKKLKSERTYKLVNGVYVPESKNEYLYNAAGQLSKIQYWLKKKDNTTYLGMTDAFEYINGRAAKIVRTNEEDKTVTTVTSFTYDNSGKITAMAQADNGVETAATVAYLLSGLKEIGIHYTYAGSSNSMNYQMIFYGGNMIQSAAVTANNNSEMGRYSYDFNINPYIHMNWPNLFLSNTNKNNMTSQYKEYHGSYPVADPYSFNYTYDADGYPTEVIKQFKSPINGNFLFSTKTVFVY